MKFYLFSLILESAVVWSEMEVVLQCENYVQVDALTVVDFTMPGGGGLPYETDGDARRLA